MYTLARKRPPTERGTTTDWNRSASEEMTRPAPARAARRSSAITSRSEAGRRGEADQPELGRLPFPNDHLRRIARVAGRADRDRLRPGRDVVDRELPVVGRRKPPHLESALDR